MTIQECYKQLGGDFAQVERRLTSAELVRKYILRFLDDGSFSELCLAMKAGQVHRTFLAAHTLMEVSANLSLTRLYASASQLTELLRAESETIPAEAAVLLEITKRDYVRATSAIRAYRDGEEAAVNEDSRCGARQLQHPCGEDQDLSRSA